MSTEPPLLPAKFVPSFAGVAWSAQRIHTADNLVFLDRSLILLNERNYFFIFIIFIEILGNPELYYN
jgi:hypothetical protein